MLDASIHFLWPEAMWNHTYLDHEVEMPDLSTIYNLFPTTDGWAMVYPVATDAHWQGMCNALKRPDLAADERFVDLQGRVLYGADVNSELEKETANFTTEELVRLMDEADVPVAPVNTREAMIAVLEDGFSSHPPRPPLRRAHQRSACRSARSDRRRVGQACRGRRDCLKRVAALRQRDSFGRGLGSCA